VTGKCERLVTDYESSRERQMETLVNHQPQYAEPETEPAVELEAETG
jgi:hypothetical protein